MVNLRNVGLVALVFFILGNLADHFMMRPAPAVPVTVKQEQKLAGNAVEAARTPAPPPAAIVPPAPAHTKVQDVTRFTVHPKAPGCPAFQMTCSTVQEADGNRRVILDPGPAATVTDTTHYQMTPGALRPPELKWEVDAIGIYDPGRRETAYGVNVTRRWGAMTTSIGALHGDFNAVTVGIGYQF